VGVAPTLALQTVYRCKDTHYFFSRTKLFRFFEMRHKKQTAALNRGSGWEEGHKKAFCDSLLKKSRDFWWGGIL
jgi:hypothetical protein